MKPLDVPEKEHGHNIVGWSISPPFMERLELNGLELYMSGFQGIHPDFGEITGSAVDFNDYPLARAWCELVERITIVESLDRARFILKNMEGVSLSVADRESVFPGPGISANDGAPKIIFQHAKSNGVALFTSWTEACMRACLELIERHLVLSSWVGLTKPETFSLRSSSLSKLKNDYDALGISFGSQVVDCFPQIISVSGCILLPKTISSPLVFGFGAGFTSDDSLRKAEQETLQRMAFLWGEPIPNTQPKFEATRQYHDDYYLNPAARPSIENWLSGKHFRSDHHCVSQTLAIEFADLSSPKRPHFHVAKAMSRQAIPLVFGKWRGGPFSLVDEEMLIHPIP